LHRHGDANPSLSVKDGENGRPLLFCHAGGDFRDIVAALERRGILPRRER
jgi:putative DNA primase/helicase